MSTIKTAVRIRPFLASQVSQGYKNAKLNVDCSKGEVAVRQDGNSNKKMFRFDYLFSQNDTQDEVYQKCGVGQMVSKALQGYHSTIFAYGQTGSGKTYTMQGVQSAQEYQQLSGVIPRAVKDMFTQASALRHQRTYTFAISFLQIYNEKIYDLLNPNSLNNRSVLQGGHQGLRLRWNKDQQFTVQNLFIYQCSNEIQIMKHFNTGSKNRINAAHKLNVQSSRSHSIFTIRIQSFQNANPSHIRQSRLQLVDLAGSQRLSQTGTEGRLAKESIDINKSLFTLRQVINILADKTTPRQGKNQKNYVPYRDSKLTSLLKQSIGGNCFALMIACLTPNDNFLDENISTLTYATKASYITNCPILNDDPKVKTIKELKRKIHEMTNQLQKANQHIDLLSNLNKTGTKFNDMKGQSKKQRQRQEEKMLPEPAFKKQISEKNGTYDSNISERLIESINMVRELLKSNKELREKLQQADQAIQQRDLQIFSLIKENEMLREGKQQQPFLQTIKDSPLKLPPQKSVKKVPDQLQPRKKGSNDFQSRKPPSVQSKRLSFKINNVLHKQIQSIQDGPTQLPYGGKFRPGVSLDMTKVYMNQKGVDSAPTNFNKRLTNTSQNQRNLYSRGLVSSQQDRHAITAKFSKRGWGNGQTQAQPRRFLSFYDDLKGANLD